MKPIRFVLMLALGALTAGVLAEEEFTKIYFGPNIGIATHPRKVFENLDLSKYELRSAANGTYYSDYTIINGAGRTIYLPLSQSRSTVDGKPRLTVKAQAYYKYSTNPYQTLQMNIVLEQRDDGIYAWCDKMYQSTSTAASEHQPYAWMYFRDLATDFGTAGSGNRVVMGDVGYDWRDVDDTFHKGFGIDNLILGRVDAAEVKITDLSGDIAVTDNCVIENPGAVRIAGTFTGGGDLTYRATEMRQVPGEVVPGGEVTACEDSCITKTWVKVAENRKLSSLTNVLVDTFGTRSGKTTGGYGFWQNDGETASVQVYAKVSSGSQYQVGSVLQFRQSGADIEASIYEAYSFEKPWEKGYSFSTYKYGDIDLVAENKKDPSNTGCFTCTIATGDLTTGTANGRAGLTNLRMYFADEILPYVSAGASVYMKSTWQTVARNRLLSTLTNVTAITCGTRTGVAVPAAYCHWRNNGSFAVVQVYKAVSAYYQTGSVLYFRQCGPDVQAAILPYSYNDPWKNGYDKDTYEYGDIDFEVCAKTISDAAIFQSLTVAKADAEGQSGLKDLKLYFSDEQPQYVETTGLNNMTTGSVVRVGGTGSAKMWLNLNHTVNEQGLPKDGTLDVGANGIVTISHSTKATRMFVHDGGIVYQATNNIFALSMPVNVSLDNGTIALGGSPMDSSIKETGTFAFAALHLVRFANGADITGHIPRVGYGVDIYPYWHVTGSSPSSCSAGFRLFESPSFVLDVEDVTDSPADDFTIGGVIDRNADETTKVLATTPVIKIGSGTVSVTAELGDQRPAVDYGLVVSNGVWRFASDKASNASLDVLLKGGRLAVASDVDAVLGKVALGVASEIALEDGASISIAAPTDANWPEKRLSFTVAGDFALNRATQIRIGTSACLTDAQLSRIRINGLRVVQDEDGYLAGTKFGILLLVR